MGKTGKSALVIFARDPAGRVKTRLVPALGAEGARGLHIACLQASARLAAPLPGSIHKRLYLSSRTAAAARRTARGLALPRALKLEAQGAGDLGARLRRAFGGLWDEGCERVVVIGSDSPTLTQRRLRQAFSRLRRADAVLGPARDGGFYLIGLRRVEGKCARLFRGIDWGTRRAFRQTLRKLRSAGLRVSPLPMGYDVDTPADLERLRRDLGRDRRPHLAPLQAWLLARPPGLPAAAKSARARLPKSLSS